MAYEAMFATISPFLVIYDNTTKASINLQKLTELETTYTCLDAYHIQTPPDQTSPFLILCSHSPPLVSYPWNHL
jgi:hypothetical protein